MPRCYRRSHEYHFLQLIHRTAGSVACGFSSVFTVKTLAVFGSSPAFNATSFDAHDRLVQQFVFRVAQYCCIAKQAYVCVTSSVGNMEMACTRWLCCYRFCGWSRIVRVYLHRAFVTRNTVPHRAVCRRSAWKEDRGKKRASAGDVMAAFHRAWCSTQRFTLCA